MKRKEQMFWFLSYNKMWCIPLCLTAFSLLPSSYIHATSIIDENTLIVNSTQQQRIVKGTVIDANGEPLIGVNVKEVGGTTGTITDINGEFSGRNGDSRRYSKEEYEKWMSGTDAKYQGWDWEDYIWVSAPQYYINTNFSGGTDKANYYVAVSHINQDATIRNYGGFRRTNVQMNIEMNVNVAKRWHNLILLIYQ